MSNKKEKLLEFKDFFELKKQIKSDNAKAGKACFGGCYNIERCVLCDFEFKYPTCGSFSLDSDLRINPSQIRRDHIQVHILNEILDKKYAKKEEK